MDYVRAKEIRQFAKKHNKRLPKEFLKWLNKFIENILIFLPDREWEKICLARFKEMKK